MPPAVGSSECVRVTGWLPCLYRHPWAVGSEGAMAVPDVTTGVLSPTSGARALEEGLPIRTLGKDTASLVDGVWGILRPPHGRSGSPGLR